jgi:hypothetical protein
LHDAPLLLRHDAIPLAVDEPRGVDAELQGPGQEGVHTLQSVEEDADGGSVPPRD